MRGVVLGSLLVFGATAPAVGAEPTPGSGAVVLPCAWDADFSATYTLELGRSAVGREMVPSSIAPVRVSVVGGRTAPTWEYVLGSAKRVAPGAEAPAPTMSKDRMEIRVQRSAAGEVELAGPDAVRAHLGGGSQPIHELYGSAADPLEKRTLLDLRPFFDEHCAHMVPGQVVRSSREVQTIAGPAPGTRVLELAEHDPAARTVMFNSTTHVDREAWLSMDRGQPPADEPARQMQAAREERAARTIVRTTATYSLDDGFPTRVELVRQTGADDDRGARAERYEWVRVYQAEAESR